MLILLVDDNGAVRTSTARLLQRAGHTVAACESIAEAMATFTSRADEFGAALLDVNIGAEDGVELCQRLKAVRPELRVAFATGSDESALRAAHHGVVFRKPCPPPDLLALFDAWSADQ